MATNKDIKTLKSVAEILKNDLAEKIELEKENIIHSLLELAKGIWVYQEVIDKSGDKVNVRMYQKEPDKEVAQYLLNQFIGKPKQNVEVAGDPDKPLVVQLAPEVAAKYNLTPHAPRSAEDNS